MTKHAVRFRMATKADAFRLTTFARTAFIDAYGEFNTQANMTAYVESAFRPDVQAAELGDRAMTTWIGERDEHLVAYAQLRWGESLAADAVIERFYLARVLHGSGAAAEMMHLVQRAARDRRAAGIRLAVWQQNPRAIAFYEKSGFSRVGTATFLLGTDEQEDWTMRAPLSTS